jgi:predicted Rossmann-fold nucleotide-binding protein
VASGDVVIALGGSWGTLSEIGLARSIGREVVLLESWTVTPTQGELDGLQQGELDGLHRAASPTEAVELALAIAGATRS